ncbi:DDE-domain-containing protein, partial [Wolfiporia cocos MD-104 SS10]
EDIYGMDESGFPPSSQGRIRVIGAWGTKTQHKQGGGVRTNVTALVTICADGSALDPMIIFKGKNFIFAYSENGWTDGCLACEWIKKKFNAQTEDKANGRPRVLLVDGHSSHYTYELLQYARAHNIIIFGYPPHCTHALQGLDVVCFARMKEVWKNEISAFKQLHKHSVTKADFAGVFGRAFLDSFTVETIKAAFEATGICPFNPNDISSEQTKPSLPTSTKGSFPLAQPSPVR